jgi:hypothetical protein
MIVCSRPVKVIGTLYSTFLRTLSAPMYHFNELTSYPEEIAQGKEELRNQILK